MRKYVAAQGGKSVAELMSDPVAVSYLQTCLKPSLGEKITGRNGREMSILAEVLDMLLHGDVVPAAEAVLQRFKALEVFAREGNWSLAQHLEVTAPASVTCVSRRELELAKSTQLMENRLGAASSGGQY